MRLLRLRILPVLLALAAASVLVAGCVEPVDPALLPCGQQPGTPQEFFLAPGHELVPRAPASAVVPGNGFTQAFVSDDMDVWESAPMPTDLWILDGVTIEFWAKAHASAAPIVIGGPTGSAYHFFNQFGTNRTFAPDYATEYADVLVPDGQEYHYVETLQMPPGGFVLPRGERLRLLLTNLVLDGSQPSIDILVGGETPSRVAFETRCIDLPRGAPEVVAQQSVTLPGNQGLLTGAIPPTEGLNRETVWFDLDGNATRLDFQVVQDLDANPVKDDVDLTFVDTAGNPLWSAGSPYSVESGSLWAPNLRAMFPEGRYGLQIDSYSGLGVALDVTVTQYA